MFWIENKVPGIVLVTAQCFTNALYVENENESGKLNIQFRRHIQTWTHLHRPSWQWTESNRATCFLQLSNCGFSLSLPLPTDFPPPLFSFLLISLKWNESNISQQHFHFLKTPFFFCYLSYFCYKTCTGCLEQQQKYNIQFICNFFCLIIINLSGESSWSFSSFWLFQVHCPKWPIVHLGVGGVRYK